MIITRTPLRLSLGGGGTDLPSYYREFGGFFVGGAINKRMYIVLNRRFESGLRASYSKTEIVSHPSHFQHPILREAFTMLGLESGLEMASFADVPASTGLGSSGSFCVGLLNALYAEKRITKSKEELAREACEIAMERLKEPSGKQDEYVASYGGINAYTVMKDGRLEVEPLGLGEDVVSELEASILMFYTGITRNSKEVLEEQRKKMSDHSGSIERMHEIKRIGVESSAALKRGDIRSFGELVHEHWLAKRGVTGAMSNSEIDKWYSIARENGALGGKIMGAGGGGFLMLVCDDGRARLREAMRREGLTEHRFKFDFEGTKVVYNN